MKLQAPTGVLGQLGQKGLLARAGWPVAAADHPSAVADLAVSDGDERCEVADLLPMPCVMTALADAIRSWWLGASRGFSSRLAISRAGEAEPHVLDAEGAADWTTLLAALRPPGQDPGEWTLSPSVQDGAPTTLLEWRHRRWTIRFGLAGDPGAIELALPAAEGPAAEGVAGRAVLRLPERVGGVEIDRPGCVLVHLVPSGGVSCDQHGYLRSPIRLPKVQHVDVARPPSAA